MYTVGMFLPSPENSPSPEEMGLEKEPQSITKTESEKSDIDKLIDARLEEVLLHGLEKVNEGHNGVIFKADIQKFPPELVEKLRETGVEMEETPAIKILKVYEVSVGRKEFDAHTAAYEVLANNDGDVPMADTPRPLLYRELESLSTETQDQLRAHGIESKGQVAMLVMELIPGEDLATTMYREILKRHPQASKIFTDVKNMRVNELFDAVKSTLKLSAVPAGIQPEKKAALIRHNASEIYGFLARNGFTIDPEVHEQAKNAFMQLHHNGIAHRDAHERNIMISKKRGKIRTTIIDFGSSRIFSGQYGDYLYKGTNGEEYIPDEELIKKLEMLTKNERALDNLFYDTKHNARLARLVETVKPEPSGKRLDTAWMKSVLQTKNSDERMEFFAATVEELFDQKLVEKEEAVAFINKKIEAFKVETAKLTTPKDKKRHDRDITLLRHALDWVA